MLIRLDVSDQKIELTQPNIVGRAPLDGGIIKQGRLQKPAEFKAALLEALTNPQGGHFKGKQVQLLMPEQHCYHQVFTVNHPADVQDRLAAALPFALDEMIWKWETTHEDGDTLSVYAVAMPRAIVDAYQEVLQSLGMKLASVEPQLYRLRGDAPLLVIDFGAHETVVGSMDEYGIHQSSVVDAGTATMRKALMTALRSDARTADQVLTTIGLRQLKHPNLSAIHAAMAPTMKQILSEAQQHRSFYESQRQRALSSVGALKLIGSGSAIPGVAETLANALSLRSFT